MIHELGQPHVFVSDPANHKGTILQDDDVVLFLDGNWDFVGPVMSKSAAFLQRGIR